MRAINTKFGTIYIEELEYDRHCPAMREEIDRIKVYDSLERYMDCWTMDYFMGEMEYDGRTEQEVYQHLIDMYEKTNHLDTICPDVRFATDDIVKFALFMKVDEYLDIADRDLITMIFHNPAKLEELVLENDYVNKIGDTYLLIEEY